MLKKTYLVLLFFLNLFLIAQDNTNDGNGRRNNNNGNQAAPNNQEEKKLKKTGWHYYAEGDYYKSIESLINEKRRYPNRIEIFVILGWDYRELKKYSLMEQISREGLKISSRDIRIIKNLAEACYYQGKYNQAIEFFEKYLKFKYKKNDPYLSNVYYYLGISFFQTDSFHKADISFSTALFYKKNNFNVYYYLAQTNEKLKRFKAAHQFYQSALKLQPNNANVLENIDRINKLMNESS